MNQTAFIHDKPDYSEEAEWRVVGSLLVKPENYYKICGQIKATDFQNREYRQAFKAIEKILSNGGTVDALTVAEEVDGDLTLQEIGDMSLNAISVNIEAYAKVVGDYSRKRDAMMVINDAAELIKTKPVDEVVASCMKGLQDISRCVQKDSSFAEILQKARNQANAAAKQRATGEILGISTTIPMLDKYTGGFHGGKLIIIGGRPGTSKSAFAEQILLRAAKKGISSGLISLEMGDEEVGTRAIANEFKINGSDYSSGHLPTVNLANSKMDENKNYKNYPFWTDYKSQNIGEIISRITEWKYKYNVKIVAVDYLQLAESLVKDQKRLEIAEITRSLKLLAMRLDIAIIALSQFSRGVEKENRMPKLSDLSESGSIEQDADVVLLLHVEHGKGQEKDKHMVILAKQRNGVARKMIDLVIRGEHFFVGEADPRY